MLDQTTRRVLVAMLGGWFGGALTALFAFLIDEPNLALAAVFSMIVTVAMPGAFLLLRLVVTH